MILGSPFVVCPRRYDVATPPARQEDGSYVCTCCGHQFTVEIARLHDLRIRPTDASGKGKG